MYNYLEAVKEDVKEYIEENIDLSEFGDIEELKEKLNEDLWINDSVTGNASGSQYTILSITTETESDCISILDSQLSDGIFENCRTGRIEKIA